MRGWITSVCLLLSLGSLQAGSQITLTTQWIRHEGELYEKRDVYLRRGFASSEDCVCSFRGDRNELRFWKKVKVKYIKEILLYFQKDPVHSLAMDEAGHLTPEDMALFEPFPGMVGMKFGHLPVACLPALEKLPNLQRLFVHEPQGRLDLEEAQTLTEKLTRLKQLSLSSSQGLTQAGFEELLKLPALRAIWIPSCPGVDKTTLPKLRMRNTHICPLSDNTKNYWDLSIH